MSHSASYRWFARHEVRLAWRDFYAMLSMNRPGRGKRIALVIAIIGAGLHLLAWAALSPLLNSGITADLPTLVMVSGFLFLPVSLMASQAMESITRAFYTRSDLELILASPAPATRLFKVRMLAIAFATTTLTLLISAPAINVLAAFQNPAWLFAYPVILSFGMMATSFAILLTMGLFAVIGPSRTRLIAQIVAAVVGAGFVIGIQLVAIATIGSISRFEFLQSEALLSAMPGIESGIWMAAKGAMGDASSALTLSQCLGPVPARHTVADRRQLCADGAESRLDRHVERPGKGQSGFLPQYERGSDVAPQGVETAAARQMADVANADATSLSHSACLHALEQFRPGQFDCHRRLCRSWSWQQGNWQEDYPGWRSPAKTHRNSSRPHPCLPGRWFGPRSKPY